MDQLAKALSDKFSLPIDEIWNDISGIATRFIEYKFISDLILAVIFGVLTVVCIWCFRCAITAESRCLKNPGRSNNIFYEYSTRYEEAIERDWWDDTDVQLIFYITSVLLTITFIGLSIGYLCCALKWRFIPEITFIQYFIPSGNG